MLTFNMNRCPSHLLHRSKHWAGTMAAPERHRPLEQCFRRLEPDNRKHTMGDAGPRQRHVAGAAVRRQRRRAGRRTEQPHRARQGHRVHSRGVGSLGRLLPGWDRCRRRLCVVRDGVCGCEEWFVPCVEVGRVI